MLLPPHHPPPALPLLLQVGADARNPAPAVLWIGVLIGVAVVGGLIALYVRKKVLAPGADSDPGTIMESLREMHRTGKMTTQEYDAARKRLASRLAGSMGAKSPARPGGDAAPARRAATKPGPGAHSGAQTRSPAQSAQLPTAPPESL